MSDGATVDAGMVTINVRLTRQQVSALDQVVTKEANLTGHNVSRAAVVRKWVERCLKDASRAR